MRKNGFSICSKTDSSPASALASRAETERQTGLLARVSGQRGEKFAGVPGVKPQARIDFTGALGALGALGVLSRVLGTNGDADDG